MINVHGIQKPAVNGLRHLAAASHVQSVMKYWPGEPMVIFISALSTDKLLLSRVLLL